MKERFGEADNKISSISQAMLKHDKYFKIVIALNAFGIILCFTLK